jgi:hypothetical protein
MASTQFSDRIGSLTGGSVHVTRVAAVILAIIASLIVWLIADPIGGANLSATGMGADDPAKIEWFSVIGAFSTWGIGSLIVIYLIDRFKKSEPQKLWLIISVIAFLISFIFVFASSENTATTITLSIMHIVSAAIIIPAFMGTLRDRTA